MKLWQGLSSAFEGLHLQICHDHYRGANNLASKELHLL